MLLRVINGGDPRWLLGLGVACGIGIENKHSTFFFIAACCSRSPDAAAEAISPASGSGRRRPSPSLLALPNLIWQVQHGFATYVDLHNVKVMHKNVELPPMPFIAAADHDAEPVARACSGFPGVGWFSSCRAKGAPIAWLGFTFLFFFLELLLMKGKDYYVAPIYPIVFAAGGVLVGEAHGTCVCAGLRYAH